MSYEENVTEISGLAAANYTGEGSSTDGRNRFVTCTGTDTYTLTAANARADGVLTSNPPQGKAGRIVIDGVVPVLVGAGGCVAGTPAGAGANGVLVTTGTIKLGIPLKDGVEGEVVPFKFGLPS